MHVSAEDSVEASMGPILALVIKLHWTFLAQHVLPEKAGQGMQSMCYHRRLGKVCQACVTRAGLTKHAKRVLPEKAWQSMQSM